VAHGHPDPSDGPSSRDRQIERHRRDGMTTTLSAQGSPPQTASPFEQNVEKVGARVLKGGAWQTAAQMAPYLLTALVSIVAARILGPDGMGRQSFISFIVLAAAMLSSAGFPTAIPRYVGELIGQGEEGKLRSLVSWSWRVELVAGSLGAGALLLIAALGATPRLAWIFGAVAVFAGVLHKVPGSILSGAQQWKQNAVVLVATGIAGTVATIAALLLGGGITSIFVVLAIINVVMLVWAWGLCNRLLSRVRTARIPLGSTRGQIARFAATASVPMILNFVVFQRSEFFFLERSSTDSQIAIYSIAFSLYAALLTLPGGFGAMFTPTIAMMLGAGSYERIRSGYARGLRLVLFIAIPVAAGAAVFGPPLIKLLYGAQYEAAGDVLLILAPSLLIAPAGGISGGVLYGYGRLRIPVVIASVSAITDLVLAALLVPHLDAEGAAIANLSAQIVGGAIGIGYCVRLVGGIQLAPRHLAKMVAAAAAAGGCAELILLLGGGAGPFFLALAVAVAVYATLGASFGVLPREDADWLTEALGSRANGRITRICKRFAGAPLGAT
jgi:O-antigen/teichoic acid export membrane protein